MNGNRAERNEEQQQIDVKRLLGRYWSKKGLIVLASVLCAVAVFLGTWFLITPQYQSSAMFYVNNYAKVSDSAGTITSSDITASKDLVESYIVILTTQSSLEEIIAYAGVNLTAEDLEDMLQASAVNSTEIFKVVVTSPDPAEALKIAQAITMVLPQRITSILDGTSAKVVDDPRLPTKPSSPSYALNTVIGFLMGFVLSIAALTVMELLDVTVHSEEDITSKFTLPILSSVPDIDAPSKGGYYSKSGAKSGSKTPKISKANSQVGAAVPFAVSEAYKLLRTKVQFSFADDNDCHVIGVSSAMAGEGKSTTAVNLAYSLAQLNNRVLLIDSDLRRPTVYQKLPVEKMPGLTNFLTRQIQLQEIIQSCTLDDVTFHVVSSGRVPPNPLELLSSERMMRAMTALRQSFDYIILDLPPVGEVSDALVAAKMTDGMLLVVRQNYCNRRLLEDTVRQFEFVDANLIGIQVTCATEGGAGFYKKYYKKYYRQYGGSYSAAARKVRSQDES